MMNETFRIATGKFLNINQVAMEEPLNVSITVRSSLKKLSESGEKRSIKLVY